MPTPSRLFTDELEAQRYVVAHGLPTEMPPALAEALASHFVLYCDGSYQADDWPRDLPESMEISIGGFDYLPSNWTIREADLRDLKMIATVTGVGLAMTRSGHGYEAITLVISGLCMLWRLQRKGIVITPLQRQLLLALRKRGPLALKDLVEAVAATRNEWTVSEVEETLRELGAVRLNDGTTEALVHQAHDGLWSTDARGLWEVPRGCSDGFDL